MYFRDYSHSEVIQLSSPDIILTSWPLDWVIVYTSVVQVLHLCTLPICGNNINLAPILAVGVMPVPGLCRERRYAGEEYFSTRYRVSSNVNSYFYNSLCMSLPDITQITPATNLSLDHSRYWKGARDTSTRNLPAEEFDINDQSLAATCYGRHLP